MSDITLNTKVFTGLGYRDDGSSWQNRESGVVTGFRTLHASINYTAKKVNVRFKLDAPTIQGDATACACPGEVLRNRYFDIVVRYDQLETAAGRTATLAEIRSLVLTTQFADYVENLTIAV